MMCNCNDIIINFTDVMTTTIPYPASFTRMPVVTIGYRNQDGSLTQMGIFTDVRITDTTIEVDHGELSSGIIRISI